MALYISSLNSGSNGNCYYVGNKNEAILVDAGISCRTIERRMKILNLDIQLIKAIFISHEHSDHIKGVETLSKKYQIPIYISEPTFHHSGLCVEKENVFHFTHKDVIQVGNIKVHAFCKIHDAKDPFSFCICDDEVQIGVFTDIGKCCDNVIHWFKGCHAAFLESNYDDEMLANGQYPYFLKQRISDGRGHLSNAIAHQLFLDHRPEFMSHLILSHLSHNNNSPEIVERLFNSNPGSVHIIVASRNEATPLYEISTVRQKKIKVPVYTQSVLTF